jgi:hypothetical protein
MSQKTFTVSNVTVTVSTRDVNLLFYRRQGIRVNTPTQVASIDGSITLDGVAGTAQASGSGTNTKRVDIMGPRFGGVGVPQAYQRVSFNVTIGVGTQTGQVSGSLLF